MEALYAASTAGAPLDVAVLNAGVGVGGGTFVDDLAARPPRRRRPQRGQHRPARRPGGRRDGAPGAGRLLITASLVAAVAGPYQTTYNASKAFLANFAEGLRYELRPPA